MKKMRILMLLLTFVLLIHPCVVYASSYTHYPHIISLRAGGGSSGGGSGSSSSGGAHGHGSSYRSYEDCDVWCLLHDAVSWICFFCLFFLTTIVLYFKVLRFSFHSKRYLKILSHSDATWKYKSIEKQVITTFYIVQDCWTKMNMEPAKEYMDLDFYETLKGKLEWMEIGNKRNVLKRIRLIDLKPILIHDDDENNEDFIWFYINGKMVDYMIEIKTGKKLEGNSIFSIPFIEFWKFVKNNDRWVLAKILQSDEIDRDFFIESEKETKSK